MKTLNYKNITVAYSDAGRGTAIVLLHGFLENRRMWDAFVPELTQKYRVITIDLLGHGHTEPLGYVHSMENNAEMVHAVLDHLRIRKCIIAGHSMGGYVALAFAEQHPDNVKALILINSTSKADNDERKANRDRAIKAVKQNYTSFVRMSIANLFSEDNRDKLSDKIEAVKLEALKTPLQGIVASLEGMKIRNDREVLLHFGPYPVMMVLGKQDPVLPYEETVVQVENTKTKLVTFPDGHMSPIENMKDLLDVVKKFLKDIL